MRLTAIRAILDDRLRAKSDHPLAVAVSGGGDSVALLLIATAWAKTRGRRVLALCVDHGLQPQGAAWVAACASLAERLGVGFQALAWTGPKPERGLPAAARAARHRLLAEAARAADARVILMGHTADDRLEAEIMRRDGSTTPDPGVWAPSPAWPEGRGLFLLRPLLGERREAIRRWLRERGETWIEDPANADPRYARARARAALAEASTVGLAAAAATDLTPLAQACDVTGWGGITIARAALQSASPAAARRFLAVASLCAAGTARPPRGDRLERLAAVVREGRPFTASLVGARIEAEVAEVRFMREAGEAARGGLSPITLPAQRRTVWDGRFEAVATAEGLSIAPLAGRAPRLPASERRALLAIPPGARGALPALIDASGAVRCPLLAPMAGVTMEPLASARLQAACGLVVREP